MSNSKFTPGPWDLIEVGDKCKHLCPSHDNLSILTVSLEYNDDDGEPTYFGSVYKPEDAHLIAAAPDMYEVLKRIEPIIEAMEMLSINKAEPGCLAEALHSAISKAEGKA